MGSKLGEEANGIEWRVNRVDRVLHQVNGLQKRSQRNASLVSALLAGVGAVALLVKIASPDTDAPFSYGAKMIVPEALQSGLAFLVLTLGCYAGSMIHVSVSKSGKFEARTVSAWEKYLTQRFRVVERWNFCASISFAVAIVLIFIALIARIVGPFTKSLFC